MRVFTKSKDECLLLNELENAISELVEKYKQDAHALTLLGDLDKSRVYNCIATQLDRLLEGGA
ncbi:hypothetical protein [Acinetobacter seifertii]|uniref:hypothetical protein n=1 Tax=Acinetobacter seifertii TaxID=1530123 RepID=UPI0032121397